MNDLIDTTEMYLRTIYDLEEEGVVPLRARIAERLEQSGPTVSQTVSRMERDGLLHVAGDRHLELTDKGRSLAVSVMRKHRLAERLLVDVIGLPWEEVHAEACRWEHVMSEDVERRLVQVLDNPTTSPFGNPIPGLSDLGVTSSGDDDVTLVRLTELPSGFPIAVRVRQLTEHVQGDADLIYRLKDAGVVPNARVTVQVSEHGSVMIVKKAPRNAIAKSNRGSISAVMSKLAMDCSIESMNDSRSCSMLGLRLRLTTHASMLAKACGSDATKVAACDTTTSTKARTSSPMTTKNTTIVISVASPRGTRRAASHVTIGSSRNARIRPIRNTVSAPPTAPRKPSASRSPMVKMIPAALGTAARGNVAVPSGLDAGSPVWSSGG